MFCVYGKSRQIAKKAIDRQVASGYGEVFEDTNRMHRATQDEKQSVVDGYVERRFKDMKPKKCSQEFSAPEFAKGCLWLMKKDKDNFSDLSLMKKQEKTKGVILSKKNRQDNA